MENPLKELEDLKNLINQLTNEASANEINYEDVLKNLGEENMVGDIFPTDHGLNIVTKFTNTSNNPPCSLYDTTFSPVERIAAEIAESKSGSIPFFAKKDIFIPSRFTTARASKSAYSPISRRIWYIFFCNSES